MDCLIHSHPGDMHSIAVALALRSRGHRVTRDVGFGVSKGGRIEIRLGADRSAIRHTWRDACVAPGSLDVVWLRRPVRPQLAADLHPADRSFAAGEWAQLTMSLHLAADRAFWVNPIERLSRATNKATQLALARGVGLPIPETLITNDVDAVRGFLGEQERTVFKPLHGALWEVAGCRLGAYTTEIGAGDLDPPERIEACPGIYQARVPKSYEVRAQFFGASCFAIRIDSQKLDVASVDWRRGRLDPRLGCTPLTLPKDVAERCRAMMHALGIVSGAFDFIVTPDDEWVFLEVNESGQFVFLEMWCPELPVFDGFVRFLESSDPDFEWRRPRKTMALADFVQSEAYAAEVADDTATWGTYRHAGMIAEAP